MQAVRKITGVVAPLDRSDVDTDQIIPASYLKRVERTGFGEGLFASWRQNDPDFVLNKPEFKGASILVAGPNFGTGSSREHAVWSLMDYGFQAVVSPRFGDIFRNNSTKSGLIPVQVDQEVADLLLKAAAEEPGLQMTIDVESRTLSVPEIGVEVEFPLDEFTQYRFLNGLDDIGLTLQHQDDIAAFEARRPDYKPVTIGGAQ
ncbi:MAG TPA: 3-isopropylmalate dehydratase small subunit [Thermomicrobiales bacterium]|jgi:3-isopropylmalate/(R)-2-methylmalate dehydratase small subunit|nr:3-isopropylmalate dehydratase small subunit [Thermomicrobiales bacterium]